TGKDPIFLGVLFINVCSRIRREDGKDGGIDPVLFTEVQDLVECGNIVLIGSQNERSFDADPLVMDFANKVPIPMDLIGSFMIALQSFLGKRFKADEEPVASASGRLPKKR